MALRMLAILFIAPLLFTCKHLTNKINESELNCGADFQSPDSTFRTFIVTSEAGERLSRESLIVKKFDEKSDVDIRISEKGCISLPMEGQWLVTDALRSHFSIITPETAESNLKLKKAIDEVPNLRCPASSVRSDFIAGNFLTRTLTQEVDFLTFTIAIEGYLEEIYKQTPINLLGSIKPFVNLKDGPLTIHLSYNDLLKDRNDTITCTLEIDNQSPSIQPEFQSIRTEPNSKLPIELIARDELIRFMQLDETDKNRTTIEYCFLKLNEDLFKKEQSTPLTKCPASEIRKTNIGEVVSPTKNRELWTLIYRSSDVAGNTSDWSRPINFAYIDSQIQNLLAENSKPEKLSFEWNQGSGLLRLVKKSLIDLNLWEKLPTTIERDLARKSILSSLYAAYIGFHMNGTVAAAKTKIDKITLNREGTILYAGSFDGYIYKIDVRSGEILGLIRPHTSGIGDIKLNLNESTLIVGSFDRTISIIKADNMTLLRKQTCCFGEYIRIAILNSKDDFATISWDNSIRVWSIEGKEKLKISSENSPNFHSDVPMAIAVSSDGKLIFTGSWDNTVKVWDSSDGRYLRKHPVDHTDDINSLGTIPHLDLVVSGSKDGAIHISSASSGELTKKISTNSSIQSITTNNSDIFVTGSHDGQIRYWNAISGEEILPNSRVEVFNMGSISSSADGKVIASTTHSPLVRIWNDTKNNKFHKTLQGHSKTSSVRALLFEEDGNNLFSGATDGQLIRWNNEGEPLWTKPAHTDTIYDLIQADREIVSLSKDGSIKTWDFNGNIRSNISHILPNEWKYSGAYIPRQKSLALSTFNGITGILNLEKPDIFEISRGQGWSVVSFDKGTNTLLIGSREKKIEILDSNNFELIDSYTTLPEAVNSVIYNPKDKKIYSALYDGNVHIYDPANQSSEVMKASSTILWDMKFSADNSILVTASNDGSLALWDIASRQMLGFPIIAHSKGIRAIEFNTEKGTILTGSDDGTIKEWSIPLTQNPLVLKALICDDINNFKDSKWFKENESDVHLRLCE